MAFSGWPCCCGGSGSSGSSSGTSKSGGSSSSAMSSSIGSKSSSSASCGFCTGCFGYQLPPSITVSYTLLGNTYTKTFTTFEYIDNSQIPPIITVNNADWTCAYSTPSTPIYFRGCDYIPNLASVNCQYQENTRLRPYFAWRVSFGASSACADLKAYWENGASCSNFVGVPDFSKSLTMSSCRPLLASGTLSASCFTSSSTGSSLSIPFTVTE